jgi:3-methyladenine DNA glycosylase AlkD
VDLRQDSEKGQRRSRDLKASLMPKQKVTPKYIADHIRRVLKDGGSAAHSKEVQWFFKEVIQSRGWYTGELRKVAVRFRRTIIEERGIEFLVQVADLLFTGRMLEEKVFAVFLLEKQTHLLSEKEFRLFASWIDRISSWADHDGLTHYLLAPMVAAEPGRCREVLRWAKSPNQWRRRAACVALIRGTREKKFFPQIKQLTKMLLEDQDDMVQKGLGWLLREFAKYNRAKAVPYLMTIRSRAPRLVLRTACETLPLADKKRILS